MKSPAPAAYLIAIVLALSPVPLWAQESGSQAQREAFLAMEEHMKISALQTFPTAGVPGSPLCEGIRLGIAWLDETHPEFFLNPGWPMKVAQAMQRTLSLTSGEQTSVSSSPAPSPTARFPLRNDAKAKAAFRARKSDERQVETLRQFAQQLDNPHLAVAASSAPPRAQLVAPTAADLAAKHDDATLKAEALRVYPAAGIPGTPLHEGIRRGMAWLADVRPGYFAQDHWPQLIATAVHKTLDPLDRITPTLPPDQKLAFPSVDDPQAAATYRRYKDEQEYADGLKRLALEIDKQMSARKSAVPQTSRQ